MSLAQVRRALGPPQMLNRHADLGLGRTYVEYAWEYGWWLVGFERQRGRLRAVRIETQARGERTANGIRWGSRLRHVLRRFPNARCRMHLVSSGRWIGGGVYVRDAQGRFTFFLISAIEPSGGVGGRPPRRGVTGFVVKEPFPEVGVSRIAPCPDDWKQSLDSP
jgi:hypothetical protein